MTKVDLPVLDRLCILVAAAAFASLMAELGAPIFERPLTFCAVAAERDISTYMYRKTKIISTGIIMTMIGSAICTRNECIGAERLLLD